MTDLLTPEEITEILELAASATAGPWKDVQLTGFGAMNFIVTEATGHQWHRIVAILESAGGFKGNHFIAKAREDVPRLCRDYLTLWDRNKELEAAVQRHIDIGEHRV